jgi:hypothetical protein
MQGSLDDGIRAVFALRLRAQFSGSNPDANTVSISNAFSRALRSAGCLPDHRALSSSGDGDLAER